MHFVTEDTEANRSYTEIEAQSEERLFKLQRVKAAH